MCGINGFNFSDEKLVKYMNKTINHRGPDDDGTYFDKFVSFGHVRLSIQDLSLAGHNPMFYSKKYGASSDKHNKKSLIGSRVCIVFNGEIYNFKELKLKLQKKGYCFTTLTDTEVILASYLEWGKNCVNNFVGMWAFCIYDMDKEELFLSRDRFGEKPLYYYLKDNKFIFSSEIKGLLVTGIDKNIDKNSLNQFFTYRFCFGEKTMLENIFNFLPGHNMIFDFKKGEIKTYEKYYDISINRDFNLSFDKAKEELFLKLESSVKSQMIADVPVATFLSGGIDSSIITYFAKKYNPNLNTFSVGFDTTNELSYAKLVSNFLKTNHREFIINKDNALDYLDEMIYHMDEPIGADPGFLPIFVLSKEVSKYNRVVLSGDGADEIFTGYDRYKLYHYGKHLRHFSFLKSNEILKRLNSMRNKDEFDSFIEITRVFEKDELLKLNLKNNVEKDFWPKLNNISSLTKAQIFDIKTLLPKDFFMKSDKMSSSFGLEQRVPFMDYKIVEFGLSLPLKYKLNLFNEKYILKAIAKDILPKEISNRRKHGFNVPIDYWFENTLKDKLKILLKNSNHNLYKKEYIYELLTTLNENKSSFKSRNIIAQKLWTVLVFEMWYEKYMK